MASLISNKIDFGDEKTIFLNFYQRLHKHPENRHGIYRLDINKNERGMKSCLCNKRRSKY